MLKFDRFNSIVGHERIDKDNGIIYGVCVMREGEAKGHGVILDKDSLNTFLALTKNRPDGIGVRFGADHDAGAADFAGTLKMFRIVGQELKADLHLLKSDQNFTKVMEMAEKMPNEFGLSASTDAQKNKTGTEFISPIRFTEINCVDIVTNPAATNGLFFSKLQSSTPMTRIALTALSLGLAANSTKEQILAEFEAKCKGKMDAEAEGEAKKHFKKKLDADAEADDEESGKNCPKHKMSAEIEGLKLELTRQISELTGKVTSFETAAKSASDAAKKAEIETLKLEASKDGKVIPLKDEVLLTLSVPDIKDMISKLPKGQVKLSRGTPPLPKTADGKEITNKRSPEYMAFARERAAQGALELGQRILAQQTGFTTMN